LDTNTNSQKAVLSWVDSETVTFLAKTAPNMLTHTETDPLASLAVKEGSENPTFTSVRGHKCKKEITAWSYDG